MKRVEKGRLPGRIMNSLLDFLFPGRCLLCGDWLAFPREPESPICDECRKNLEPLHGRRCRLCSMPLSSEDGICTRCRVTEFAFEENHSVFAYGGAVKELIAGYKFSGRIRLSSLFARYLASAVKAKFPGAIIVPVPPRPGAVKPDHVERIARRLETVHGLAIVRPLQRTGGVSQKSLDFEERKSNLRGMVRVRSGFPAAERAVLLDDVFTTGATADVCARALRDAGWGKVFVATLAIDM